MSINNELLSLNYRKSAMNYAKKKILIANLNNTLQEKDLTKPTNCQGFGRIRHFKRNIGENWPNDPLPLDPACKALGLERVDIMEAQVFQLAACNFRCWYCFVPYNLISANVKYASMLTASELIDLYVNEKNSPLIIDLSGGQPDIVPEWVPWMMSELKSRNLHERTYLWSDDNLSNDFFWRFLNDNEINVVENYTNYGRVCCFKGFDEASFYFNTGADPILFNNQFVLFEKYLSLKIDLYAYVTLTAPSTDLIRDHVITFIDRLQKINEYLPLRTIPLKIVLFTPVKSRLTKARQNALYAQEVAIEVWLKEIENRFSSNMREACITDISLIN